MSTWRRTIAAAAVCALVAIGAERIPAAAQFIGGYGAPPLGDAGDLVGWELARSQRMREIMLPMSMASAAEEHERDRAYADVITGKFSPAVRFSDGGDETVVQMAASLVPHGTAAQRARAQAYLTARRRDYERAMRSQGVPANSLTSACAYLVESLYAVGSNEPSSQSDREGYRAGCAMKIGAAERSGGLASDAERTKAGTSTSILGASMLELRTETAQREQAPKLARALFKRFSGYSIAAVPPAHFPCVVLDQAHMPTCADVLAKLGSRITEAGRRN